MLDRTRDALPASLATSLSRWTEEQRLYTLRSAGAAVGGPAGDGDPIGGLMVERFRVTDAVSEPFHLELDALSPDAFINPHTLLGSRVALHTTLADGSRCRRSGLVMQARAMGSDGGLARYRLCVQPWVALLAHQRHSRAWQDLRVPEVIEAVLAAPAYRAHAAWRWGDSGDGDSAEDLTGFLSRGPNAGVRPYCVQYRETDLAFVQRLLAEEGMGWRVEECDTAASGHRLVFFADSACWPQNASSRSPWGGTGLRFHGASALEPQDTVQRLGQVCRLQPTGSAVLHWDPRSKAAVAAEASAAQPFGSPCFQDGAAWLQHYDPQAPLAGGGRSAAKHRAACRQQAFEARHETWLAQGTVRSLRAGEWFTLTQGVRADVAGQAGPEFVVHAVQAVGLNNLPKALRDRLASGTSKAAGFEHEVFAGDSFDGMHTPEECAGASLGAADSHPDNAADAALGWVDLLRDDRDDGLIAQAAAHGHANRFLALPRTTPWRPLPRPRITALGLQTALVVGPDGQATASGAHELHTDALGRIQVRFHWQAPASAEGAPPDDGARCWVRVAQRWAGAGTGQQFIPRIGQEVLVQFVEGDVDRPICIGAVFNGRGEAGASACSRSTDHRPAAQGNHAGGQAPAWHGGAPGLATPGGAAQNNRGALSGVKSKEFGGEGFNQLAFDDTPGELRVQLSTTQHATQLNLGHLVHAADNHRGSFRGRGFELRTDAYGALRGARGLLVTSQGTPPGAPAGDNTLGMALLKQAVALADCFAQAARTHQTTVPALAAGTVARGASVLSGQAAPLRALQRAIGGMVGEASFFDAIRDAGHGAPASGPGTVPHTTDPVVALSGHAGLAVVAGQALQFASDDAIGWLAGQDLQVASGHQLRLHTGQSIGVLGGAVDSDGAKAASGAVGTGLTLIAAQGEVQLQAQTGEGQVAARGPVDLHSAQGGIDWAAARKLTLQTSGGARVVIEASGIEVACPGKITVHAARKSFVGPASERQALPQMPRSFLCTECLHKAMASGSPLAAVS